jgi:hypothetical protein
MSSLQSCCVLGRSQIQVSAKESVILTFSWAPSAKQGKNRYLHSHSAKTTSFFALYSSVRTDHSAKLSKVKGKMKISISVMLRVRTKRSTRNFIKFQFLKLALIWWGKAKTRGNYSNKSKLQPRINQKRLNSESDFHRSVKNLLSSRLFAKNIQFKICWN